jgi:hypothetical protein
MSNKKRFWRNFTLKKFLLITLYLFAVTLIVGAIWDYITKIPVSILFTTSELLQRAFTAIIVGFILSGLIKMRNSD